jgi:hypothetical protein
MFVEGVTIALALEIPDGYCLSSTKLTSKTVSS